MKLKNIPRVHFLAFIFLVLIAANACWLNAFSTPDARLSDVFVRQVASTLKTDSNIVIVDIDETSIAAMQDVAGSWPWPRAVHGELLAGIARQQPAAIVFDILFSEPDRYRPDSDQLFNEVLSDMHNVYLPMLQLQGKQGSGVSLAALAKLTDLPHTTNPTQMRARFCSHHKPSLQNHGASG